jgi:hypothetical protein
MPLILGTNSIKDTTYDVANSLRFDNDSQDSLSRTPSSTSNRRTFTFSTWFKLSGTDGSFISAGTDISNGPLFIIDILSGGNEGILRVEDTVGGNNVIGLRTSRKLRDVSAWMHVVVGIDTTQATASNRVKVYINGVQETSFGTETYPDQNQDLSLNQNHDHRIGTRAANTSGKFWDGYLCETVLIDGQQLDATSFGEFDSSSNIWKPKDVSGLTFGTNGFYLDYEDSSSLGKDVSGNGNNFTANNLTSIDQTADTCTNNFATLNSLINFNSGDFSNGNLAITFGDDTVSTIGLTKGRWYWEAERSNSTNEAHFGIGVSNGFYSATSVVSDGDRLYVRGGTSNFNTASNLSILTFGSNSGTPASFGSGDILSFYLDLESSTKNIIIKKNDGATPLVNVDLTYSGEEPIFPYCRMNSGVASRWNFGNPMTSLTSANTDANGFGSFEFSPTLSGVDYFAICTKNLAEYG